jgi:hypothetical protein
MKNIKYKELFLEIFYCLSAALAILSMMEFLKEGLVSAYVNINTVLLAWLFIAIIILAADNKGAKKVKE